MKSNKKLRHFWRVFKYVWPQWHRLAVIWCSAILIGVLFSLSFATVIPLLKVMMGEEGLHGWVDRKTCDLRYGVDFDVPDRTDLLSDSSQEIAYYLLVTKVDEEKPGYKAGIKPQDIIVGVDEFSPAVRGDKIPLTKLLEKLALAPDAAELKIYLKRSDETGQTYDESLFLKALPKPDNLSSEEYSFRERLEWGFKWAVVTKAQWLVGFMSRENTRENKEKAIVFIILVMAVVTIARCTATFCQKYLAEKVVQVAFLHLRRDFFAHVMYMPIGYFSTEGTSDTISRLLGDTAATGKGVKILLGKALREPIKAICCLVIAFIISWQLTLIFLCVAPVTFGMLALLGKKIKKATRKALISTAKMLGKVQGTMSALRVVKVYNQQEHEIGTFDLINRTFVRRALRISKISSATGPMMEVLGMFAGSAALIIGAHWVTGARMDSSSFFGLLLLLGTSAESIRKASDVWNKVQEANAASERVFAVIDMSPEAEEPDAAELSELQNELEFRNIVFTYPKSDEPVLRGIYLTVSAGRTVAVVGPNGSGKTTLINLIPRFYDPDSGQILIDGRDIRHATLKSLRDQIGMVTQNVVTFNDTIAANIAYGNPGASREQIIAAAKRSFAHEFIEPLPEGYDTVIGEHGSGFSGGQLQRIVIARAIVKNPAILIFDEAMSQVDADSEAKIHDALAELMKGRTCFIIAHRFSTVISADTIVVMDGGIVVAQGTHEALTKDCQVYKNLYETQLIAPQ
jgi:ABC-type multidrug transport system fused ATPase/permease subunit